MQEVPIHQTMFIDESKFHKQFLKRVAQGTSCEIISKSDQKILRRRFLRLSSCPRSPHSPEPCFWTDQNFTIFAKGHPRNIPVKLFQNLTNGFREEDYLIISSYLYCTRIPHSPGPCLWTDQNFANKCLKRVAQGTFL